jgi:hypothetical protein
MDDVLAAHEIDQQAALRAAAACGTASPLQVTAAAPFWRALSYEGALWLLTALPRERES